MRKKEREAPAGRRRNPQRKVLAVVLAGLVIVTIGILLVLPKWGGGRTKKSIPALPLVPREASARHKDEVNGASPDYLFPKSDRVLLTDADIKDCDREKLKLGRNEIFARHGYVFQTAEITEYFESKSWYRGTTPGERFDSNKLSGIELQNIDFLFAAQKRAEYKDNVPRFIDKIVDIQKDFLIPQKGTDASTLIRALLRGNKPVVLAFRLVDLNHDAVPALFFAYLTNANGPSDDNIQMFSGWWEVWTIDKNEFVCAQKEQFQVSATGGGDSLTAGICSSDMGKSDRILTYYSSTQDISKLIYTFVEESGVKDRYQIHQYWGEDAREPDGTHNGGKLTDAAMQLKRCAEVQAAAQPLFFIGFNAAPETADMIEIYDDISQNIHDADAVVRAVTEEAQESHQPA